MVQYCDFKLDSFKISQENSDGIVSLIQNFFRQVHVVFLLGWKSDFWENQAKAEGSPSLSLSPVSQQLIDFNLNLSQSDSCEAAESKHQKNFFNFDSQNISALFDCVHPGYVILNPAPHITITCPRVMGEPSTSEGSRSLELSPRSPIEMNPLSSFVAVRWSLVIDNMCTDLVAEFDKDTRFSNLTRVVYSQ